MDPDYNQGDRPNVQVPQAEEIRQAQNVFQRAADAILQLGELRSAVADLQRSVSQMQHDMDRLRQTNNSLEEALTHSRAARQELERQNNDLHVELSNVKNELTQVSRDRDYHQQAAQTLEVERNDARKRGDDAELRVMELEDKLKDAEGKLNTLQESFRKIFGQIEQPKATPPEPKREYGDLGRPVTDPQPQQEQSSGWPIPAPEPIFHGSEQPQPEQAQTKRRIYEGEPGFSWDRNTEGKTPEFDDVERKWFIEA